MGRHYQLLRFASALTVIIAAGTATAQNSGSGAEVPAGSEASKRITVTGPLTFAGYVEGLYQWNFNRPSNGITNYRGFDNRHNSFTLSNVALDAQWDSKDILGRVTLQVGHTPSTYYLGEPNLPGASGANSSSGELWKYVQQAYSGYRFGVGRGLAVSAGVFLSPIGPETMPMKDNWNLSRSNLFFGLPFYHTGVKATYTLSDKWSVTVGGFNGWNSVVDNNTNKSLATQFNYTTPKLAASLLYFGGVEQPRGSAAGKPWRHLFDGYVTWQLTPCTSVMAHANTGFEQNTFGVSRWLAGALYVRYQAHEKLFLAARADGFSEKVPDNDKGQASAIFWPAAWVSSGTATIDFRPRDRVSFRAEYRHDRAASPMYFGGNVVGDGIATAFAANRDRQNTITVSVTSWF